jgi:NAD-dependent deacetylase
MSASSPKRKLVVLTGAGMSAESGLRTFRGADGLWENHRVEDVATPEGWARDPQLVLRFYNERRRQMWQAKPNAGHLALAQLERDFDVRIITQNVDNLHERAGSTHVLHLHGELTKARSSIDEDLVQDIDGWELKWGERSADGSQLRPFIVWFGEAVPMMEEAIALTEQADFFAVIGTSLAVYPAASLIDYVPPGVLTFLIDPQPTATAATSAPSPPPPASAYHCLPKRSACRAPLSPRPERRRPPARHPPEPR